MKLTAKESRLLLKIIASERRPEYKIRLGKITYTVKELGINR